VSSCTHGGSSRPRPPLSGATNETRGAPRASIMNRTANRRRRRADRQTRRLCGARRHSLHP
jgi:hypothetical protein